MRASWVVSARSLVAGVALAAGALPLSAQRPDSALVRSEPGRPLFTRRDVAAAGALAALTVALLPADRRIAEEFRDPGPQRSRLLRNGARTFDVLGDPGTVVIGVGAYGLGRLARSEHLADLGLHTTE